MLSDSLPLTGRPIFKAREGKSGQDWEIPLLEETQQILWTASFVSTVFMVITCISADQLALGKSNVQESPQIFRHRSLSLGFDLSICTMNDSSATNKLYQAFSQWSPDNRAEGRGTHSEFTDHSDAHLQVHYQDHFGPIQSKPDIDEWFSSMPQTGFANSARMAAHDLHSQAGTTSFADA